MTAQGDTPNLAQEVSIITIIINGITCPFTVLFNVLVIMAVKRRRRLQSNPNILLACLAATDALTGLVVQPSFIAWKTFYLLNYNGIERSVAEGFHKFFLRALTVCSSLHLILITCERLIAIKFTMSYPYIVTNRKITVAVLIFWAFSFIQGIGYFSNNVILRVAFNLILSLAMTFCILFITITYAVLYRESRRHQSMMKAQQLPQEEVERFVKENKVLKTTAFVVSAVLLSFLPMALGLAILSMVLGVRRDLNLNAVFVVWVPLARTCAVLNSLLNPLIYCLRQKEMRKFVFRVPCKPVGPAMN
ncbi:alpha-1A adrenergic receptor-like [Orbicella faveolata]|uniref:alpha-1A adrenergic receptor-like n=1 Tax=Orbicella faveolata TaxID=48498 RepID=UPI0009E49B2F|nr:alpha-1A adrenergic receptor-like [Orbicella faveolata]